MHPAILTLDQRYRDDPPFDRAPSIQDRWGRALSRTVSL